MPAEWDRFKFEIGKENSNELATVRQRPLAGRTFWLLAHMKQHRGAAVVFLPSMTQAPAPASTGLIAAPRRSPRHWVSEAGDHVGEDEAGTGSRIRDSRLSTRMQRRCASK
jgi:hypothetical protein